MLNGLVTGTVLDTLKTGDEIAGNNWNVEGEETLTEVVDNVSAKL